MPNHVHFVVELREGRTVSHMIHGLKSFTGRKANALLGRTGPFWQREYYDRYIRDGEHLASVMRYIEENPVKAKLVKTARDWPWGSARLRMDEIL